MLRRSVRGGPLSAWPGGMVEVGTPVIILPSFDFLRRQLSGNTFGKWVPSPGGGEKSPGPPKVSGGLLFPRSPISSWRGRTFDEDLTLAEPLETSKRGGPLVPRIDRVSYTHDAMIDLVLQNPMISQNQIAEHFGYTPAWVSIVFNSDAFQARLADRKTEIIDPLIRGQVEEAIKGLVSRSVEILREKLNSPNENTDLALEVFKASTRAAGYGARTNNTQVNINAPGSLVSVLAGMDK